MSETTVDEVKVEETVTEEVEAVAVEETKTSNDKAKKSKKEKAKKKNNWFKGLRAEFKKIVWPDKKTLVKQTVAVISCSVVLALIIMAIDSLLKLLVNLEFLF